MARARLQRVEGLAPLHAICPNKGRRGISLFLWPIAGFALGSFALSLPLGLGHVHTFPWPWITGAGIGWGLYGAAWWFGRKRVIDAEYMLCPKCRRTLDLENNLGTCRVGHGPFRRLDLIHCWENAYKIELDDLVDRDRSAW